MQCTCAILSSVACPALQYFSTFSQTAQLSKWSYWTQKEGLVFSTTFVLNTFHSVKNWARYDQKCILVLMLITYYSCLILMKLVSSHQFQKNTEIPNFMKICCSKWTDMTKLTVVCLELAKKWFQVLYCQCQKRNYITCSKKFRNYLINMTFPIQVVMNF
jgi:hypothetical protein